MSYVLIVAGLMISAGNLHTIIKYFNDGKTGTIPPFFGGVYLMLGVTIAFPVARKYWYLFLMLDVSFYVWPYIIGCVIMKGVYLIVKRVCKYFFWKK